MSQRSKIHCVDLLTMCAHQVMLSKASSDPDTFLTPTSLRVRDDEYDVDAH